VKTTWIEFSRFLSVHCVKFICSRRDESSLFLYFTFDH